MIGLAATVLVTFYGQTRIFMRMSSDGMLPDRLGRVSERLRDPDRRDRRLRDRRRGRGRRCCRSTSSATSSRSGRCSSFTIVCAGVLVLRRTRPDLERPFRVKRVWLVAPLGIVFAIALMATLPVTTWIRLGVWLLIGLVIYFLYARGRTNERMNRLRDAEPYVEPVT